MSRLRVSVLENDLCLAHVVIVVSFGCSATFQADSFWHRAIITKALHLQSLHTLMVDITMD